MSEHSITHLILTEAHHKDGEFYTLGRIPLEGDPATMLRLLPSNDCGSPATCEVACFIVDAWSGEYGVVDDKEVSREVAVDLLGGPAAFRRAQDAAREELAWVYQSMASA